MITEPLKLLQECINTRFGRRADEWGDPEQLRAWLLQRHLLTEEQVITRSDYQRMIEAREAIRGLLYMNSEGSVEASSIDVLNHLSQRAPLQLTFQQNGQANLASELTGIDGVIAKLFGIIFTAMADGSWSRLKVCHNEKCQRAFYDVSKNRSGTWCSMKICGSRAKARAYQHRHQQKDVV
ncbi:hypothetical protein KDH_22330 [Dictyobacter sp. S3.2.2.5]|uniref:Zinc finger CGNR domain-containing protein n=1 Tax=Dictyobacter halimunensis TaxID=3026934 RepID=A0ABQ6FMA6_9CHLR|nr:hypothetical protein KDH_22330 [Dictyobacter sp. S3.2.2.5]